MAKSWPPPYAIAGLSFSMKYRKSDYSVSSYFVIPLTLIFLGLVAFIAAAKASEALARFSAITLILMLALRLNGRLGLAGLKVAFGLEARRLFRGEEFELRAENSQRQGASCLASDRSR